MAFRTSDGEVICGAERMLKVGGHDDEKEAMCVNDPGHGENQHRWWPAWRVKPGGARVDDVDA